MIIKEIENAMNDNTGSPQQRFLALFLAKEATRRISDKRIYQILKVSFLNSLLSYVVRMRGRGSLNETGSIFNEAAFDEEYDIGVQFYQLACELLHDWAKKSGDPDYSQALRQTAGCPQHVLPHIYLPFPIDEVQKANLELKMNRSQARGMLNSQPIQMAASQPAVAATNQFNSSRLVPPRYNFPSAVFRELEEYKQDLFNTMNAPNASKAAIDGKRIMFLSFFDARNMELQEALLANNSEQDYNNMTDLFNFANFLQQNDQKLNQAGVEDIRRIMAQALAQLQHLHQSNIIRESGNFGA